jgi:signal transduction histidine kinase
MVQQSSWMTGAGVVDMVPTLVEPNDETSVPTRMSRLAALGDCAFFTVHAQEGSARCLWFSAGGQDVLGVPPVLIEGIPDALLTHVHRRDRDKVLDLLLSQDGGCTTYRWRVGGNRRARWTRLQIDLLPTGTGLLDGRIRAAEADQQLQGHLVTAVEHERVTLVRRAEVEDLREHILRAMSHRVRTPLAILRAACETAAHPGTELTRKQRDELFATITRASGRLEALLTDLLDLPHQGLADVAKVSSISQLVSETVASSLSDQHPVSIDIDPTLRLLEGAVTVRRCLVHLLENIVQHTPPGTPVQIRAARMDDNLVRLVIADDGPGLADSMSGRVFEPFLTSHHGADPSLGIGLAVVQHLANQLGGMVYVESCPGHGVTVTMDLPGADRA